MNTKQLSSMLMVFGFVCIVAAGLALQFGAVMAQGAVGVELPTDYRFWFHVNSSSITEQAATTLQMPVGLFGDTFDAIYANEIALNDLRSGSRPFRDGASFVAPFYRLENPVPGLDAPGDLVFTAVMLKDSQAYADTFGWGFEVFAPDGTVMQNAVWDCAGCHESQAANDYVFSTITERTPTAVLASANGVYLPPAYRSMYFRGSKVIRPDAATALGLPPEIFGNTIDAVYLNREALQALRQEVRPFPVGSLIVADFHVADFPVEGMATFGDPAFSAVMLKTVPGTGDDPSTGDWRFAAFAPDGTSLEELRPACIACHAPQAANDYVFTGG